MNERTQQSEIHPGLEVDIVLKKDQRTGALTHGVVKDILTSSATHHRGIKVRLEDGQIGRVQRISGAGADAGNEEDEGDELPYDEALDYFPQK